MLASFQNSIFKQFAIWTSIFIAIWVVVGVSVGVLLNPELAGHPYIDPIALQNMTYAARGLLSLSIFIDGTIIMVYMISTHIRKRDVSFVICLIIADFINMVARFISTFVVEEEEVCRGMAVFVGYGSLSSTFWNYIVSFYLYHRIVKNVPPSDFGNTKVLFHLFGWVVPILPVLCAAGFHHFGKAGIWCFVTREYPAFRLFYFYLPLAQTFFFSGFCLLQIILKIRSVIKESSVMKTTIHIRLSVYLAVFCFFNSWGVAFRISNIIDPDHYILWLYYIYTYVRALSGTWDGILFGYTFWGEIKKIYFSKGASSGTSDGHFSGNSDVRGSTKIDVESGSKTDSNSVQMG